jgi:release factor glutamine methyltransferase
MTNSVKSFFETNQELLIQNYPGLTYSILERELSHIEFNLNIENKLKEGVPLSYITNEKYAYQNTFYVDERVLIPRNETEILIDEAIKWLKQNKQATKVIDVGVGTGVILLSILNEIQDRSLQAWAVDVSFDALEVFKINCERQKYARLSSHTVNLYQNNLLNHMNQTFDLIVSNPPYIKTEEDKATVHAQVLHYEPHKALFVLDAEYEAFFKTFFKQIELCLAEKGMALIEGHENHLEQLKEWASKLKFSKIEILKDYTQRDRFLKILK